MAEEKGGATPTQEQLAKEVLSGERVILASETKMADDRLNLTPEQMKEIATMQAKAGDSIRMAQLPDVTHDQDKARASLAGITTGNVEKQQYREVFKEDYQQKSPTPPEPEK